MDKYWITRIDVDLVASTRKNTTSTINATYKNMDLQKAFKDLW